MNRILHNRLCGRLSLLLAIMLVLPSLTQAAWADGVPNSKPVIISAMPDDQKISIGKGESIEVGDKGTVSRDGKEIAKLEVTSVEWGYSRIKISDMETGQELRVGDAVTMAAHSDRSTGKKVKKGDGAGKALLALLVVGAVVALSHHGGGGGGSSSGTTNLALAAKDTSLPADGTSSTTVSVTVSDANNAAVADGTPVTFSSSAGSISPAHTTTTGGKATATLTAGSTAGTCTVTATVGSKTSNATVSFITSSQGSKGSILLATTMNSIQVVGSGGSQTQTSIQATCRDAQGNLATSGTVTFSSTLGSVVGTATINSSGIATTTFSSSSTGNATITASWSGATSTIDVTLTAGPPNTITVESTPQSIQADGHAFSIIKATVRDIGGNMVTDGTVVSFAVQADVLGGGNGTMGASAQTISGIATTQLVSRDSGGNASKPGTATVYVSVLTTGQPSGIPVPAVSISNHATQVQFISQDVATIVLGADKLNIRGLDVVNQRTTVLAMVYDSHHNPVPDGTAVYFTADHGMIYGNSGTAGNVTVSTTSKGLAEAILASAGEQSGWNGLVGITAVCGNIDTTSKLVTFSGWPSLTTSKADISKHILLPSSDSAVISVTVHDVNNNPVVDGTKLTVTTTQGTTVSPSSPLTSGGVAQITLSTSTDNTNPTPAGPGTVTILVDSGGHNPETNNGPLQLTADFTVQ